MGTEYAKVGNESGGISHHSSRSARSLPSPGEVSFPSPGSQREESPRGEEPRAAGARANEGPGGRSRQQPNRSPVRLLGRRSGVRGSDGWNTIFT
jgi:hypothetical protein